MSKYIWIVLLVLVTLGAGCSKQSTTNSSEQQSQGNATTSTDSTEPQPELSNLGGISFGAYNASTKLAGDIRMDPEHYLDEASGHVVPMYVFGQPLPGRSTTQLNPNVEFGGLKNPITLVSALDGVVGFVRQQTSSNDYEVFIQPKENSEWTIGYDHVTDVTVKQGDRVTVGQVLGKAAKENNGTYRYEFQINRDVNGVTTFYCPTALLNARSKATYTTKIEQFINDWNTMTGKKSYGIYATSCTKDVLALSETQ